MFQPDTTLYHMWNLKTQEEFFATNAELSEQGVLISHLKAGISNHCRGITLFEKRDIPIKRKTFVHHHMWNHNTQEEFYATSGELNKNYKVRIDRLKAGEMVHQKGICLFDNKDVPYRDTTTVYHLWDHNTGEEVKATSPELKRKYGISVSVLVGGKRNCEKGLCLFDNKDKTFTLYKPRK